MITREAIEAHKLYVVEVRHPVEVPGEEREHLLQWLSKRLSYELRAPDSTRVLRRATGGKSRTTDWTGPPQQKAAGESRV